MKLTWKKNPSSNYRKRIRNPLESQDESQVDDGGGEGDCSSNDFQKLSDQFQAQGNKLAEEGKCHEALAKWEAAINLTPEKAVLHEQKAQILLEVGDAWKALKAATRATQLEPSWPEAWITLGRAQLNFGEPDNAIESFDRALVIKPDSVEAIEDRQTAARLIKKRKQLHASGLVTREDRFVVSNNTTEEQTSSAEHGKDGKRQCTASQITYE